MGFLDRFLMGRSSPRPTSGSDPRGAYYSEERPPYPANIAFLEKCVATAPDLLTKHFAYSELEAAHYKARDLDEGALLGFDAACAEHDRFAEEIVATFVRKWGEVPGLPLYRQSVIRFQKAKEYDSALWWARRGIEVHESATRGRDVEEIADLEKRIGKLEELRSKAKKA